MKMRETNIERDEDRIEEQIEKDWANIDLDKIKKYFKNVINDQNFLRNYEAIKKGGNTKVLSAEDRNKHETRKDQMQAAKFFLLESTRNQKRMHDHPLKAMEKTKEIT